MESNPCSRAYMCVCGEPSRTICLANGSWQPEMDRIAGLRKKHELLNPQVGVRSMMG